MGINTPMTGPSKSAHASEQKRNPYPLSKRVKTFFGTVSPFISYNRYAKPPERLLRVAVEGLRQHTLPERLQEKYATRVKSSKWLAAYNIRLVFGFLKSGNITSEKAQVILCESLAHVHECGLQWLPRNPPHDSISQKYKTRLNDLRWESKVAVTRVTSDEAKEILSGMLLSADLWEADIKEALGEERQKKLLREKICQELEIVAQRSPLSCTSIYYDVDLRSLMRDSTHLRIAGSIPSLSAIALDQHFSIGNRKRAFEEILNMAGCSVPEADQALGNLLGKVPQWMKDAVLTP